MQRHIDHLRLHSTARADPEVIQGDSMSDLDLGVPEVEGATAMGVPDSTTAAGAPCPHTDDTPRPTSS